MGRCIVVTDMAQGYTVLEFKEGIQLDKSQPKYPFGRVREQVRAALRRGFDPAEVVLIDHSTNRTDTDICLRDLIRDCRDDIDWIVDITRYQVPQISGKVALKAFVFGWLMAHHHGFPLWSEAYAYDLTDLDFENGRVSERSIDGESGGTISFERLYARIKDHYPLVIFWNHERSHETGFHINPSYVPTKTR